MKVYPEELKAFDEFHAKRDFAYFTEPQIQALRSEAKKMSAWHRKHPVLHNWIGAIVLLFLVTADLFIISYIPRHEIISPMTTLLLIIGHGLFMYNIIGYTLHEGSYHRMIIIQRGPLTKVLSWVSVNICRLWYCDPIYYRQNHHGHHVHLGTEKDGTFTNFVHPKRFLLSLGPLASALNYNDYKLHTGEVWTRSQIVSESLSFGLVIAMALPLILKGNGEALLQYALVIFFGTWISFVLDRIRETTEHNLMPNDPFHGAKEFGLNFGGLFFGGGPWGQPCHLTHHMAPGLPWYQQLRFHRRLLAIMTPEQKKQYVVHPIWGVLTLLYKNLTIGRAYIKRYQRE